MVTINRENRTSCSGCSACANICPKNCITMKKDEWGFLYPQVDKERCVDCSLCEQVCPDFSLNDQDLVASFAAQGTDDALRRESSSGGLFTEIAQYILSQNGVVFGAAFTEDFYGVRHIAVQTKEELYQLRGSKYLQSDLGNSFQAVKEYLEEGRPVLFSGTPCQIAGLKSFLCRDYAQLYLLGVVCHGVPAPAVWQKYLSLAEQKYGSKAKSVSFRDKRYGWHNYVLSIRFENGKELVEDRVKNLFMRGFLQDVYLRPSCFECKQKGLRSAADILLGDLWGAEEICPEQDDNKGTSLLMVFSSKAERLLEQIKSSVRFQPIETKYAVKHNPAIVQSSKMNSKSVSFETEFLEGPCGKVLKKYCAQPLFEKTIVAVKRMLKKVLKYK